MTDSAVWFIRIQYQTPRGTAQRVVNGCIWYATAMVYVLYMLSY